MHGIMSGSFCSTSSIPRLLPTFKQVSSAETLPQPSTRM